jgi:hypothetical protein
VLEHKCSVIMFHVIVQLDTVSDTCYFRATCRVALRLTKRSRRRSSPLNQVECAQEHLFVIAPLSDEIKASGPQATGSPSMMQVRALSCATDSAMRGKRRVRSLPGRLVEPHPAAVLAGDDPKAIVVDLVQPTLAGRRSLGRCGEARLDEPRRAGECGRDDMGREIR